MNYLRPAIIALVGLLLASAWGDGGQLGAIAAPAHAQETGRIAFTRGAFGSRDIYVMNADGSDQTNLTKNPASDRSPAWSLDGKRIAFDSDRDGDDEIYVMNADGSDVTRLTDIPVEADEAEHVEGDEQEDGDAGAFAYLEAAPKDQVYLVEMTSFAYAPEALEVTAGDVLEIAVQNVEAVLHDFTIDEIDADVHVSYLAGTGQHAHAESQLEADVHFALTEPGTGVVHMKIHEPGEYVFYCSVPGHREAGMEGTLIVQ